MTNQVGVKSLLSSVLSDFAEAFARGLPATPVANGYTVTTVDNQGDNAVSERLQPKAV